MKNIAALRRHGLFDARVPRYTSYPPATAFGAQVDEHFQNQCLTDLNPDTPVSVYIHIPFCERLCWFCACRTQGTSTIKPVEAYLDTVLHELDMLRQTLPPGIRMGQLHWGGGTPTILTAPMIRKLFKAVVATLPPADDFSFSVEIDPTLVDDTKIAALADIGMTRASIGVLDFAPDVQDAIGRQQSFDATQTCVGQLRQAGIRSLNVDLVYGLPHQTQSTLSDTLTKTRALRPDRIALFGYAHVPEFSKRQKLIPQTALPNNEARYHLAQLAADVFTSDGCTTIGIDHLAKPADSPAKAQATGRLRRNFQGYTDDTCPTLVGIGASAISQFAAGYVQNAPATAAYTQRINAQKMAGCRGYAMTPADALQAEAISMLMCNFEIDLHHLRRHHKDADQLGYIHDSIQRDFGDMVALDEQCLRIATAGRLLTRIIAQRYDGHSGIAAQYSKAS